MAVPRAAEAGCRAPDGFAPVVVLDVLPREEAQVVPTERDHTIETFLFDRPHERFGVRVEIGTPRRQPNGLDPAAHQDVGHDSGVQGIP